MEKRGRRTVITMGDLYPLIRLSLPTRCQWTGPGERWKFSVLVVSG
jgi:hypothetical protein